jgi:CDP-6-deoxy-D-xylo-4-hexulose-3-dehydrase
MKTWKLMDNAIPQEQREKLSQFILLGDRFSQGDLVREFEKKWSEWQGCKYSVFVNSGSSANLLAVYAASPHGGDTWVSQACTWATTVTPIMMSGNYLQLCDVDIPSLSPNIDSLKFIIQKRKPKYLFLANLLGFSSITEEILDLCQENDITLLEDCCESHGAESLGKKVGNFGKISTFSFYYGHHMTTIEGGMCCTDDEKMYERLLLLRSHGLYRELPSEMKEKYSNLIVDENFTFLIPGLNVRSTEINALLGLMQLENLDKHNQIRRENFKIFSGGLDGDKFYSDFPVEGNSSFCFPIILKHKGFIQGIRKKLMEMGVETRPIIGGNLYRHPFMNSVNQYKLDKNAEIVHANGFYVGNNHNVKKEDVVWLIDNLNNL